jgi:hypothetical protein
MGEALRVSSGVSELDRLLGGLFIGDTPALAQEQD